MTRRLRIDRSEQIYTLFARLACCGDLDSALGEVLEASLEVVESDAGYIRLFEPDETDPLSSRYSFVVHKGMSDRYLEYFSNLPQPVDPAARRAVFDGRRIFVPDMYSYPAFAPHREIVVEEGYRTLLATPLMSRNGSQSVGTIHTYFREVTELPDAVETLDLYAEVAASTIDHHRQVAQLYKRTQALETLAERQMELLDWAGERLRDICTPTASHSVEDELRQLARSIGTRAEQLIASLDLAPMAGAPCEDDTFSPYGLSPREVEVLLHLWRGFSDNEIAAEMGVSRFTVAKYIASAMRKLDVDTRAEAGYIVARDVLAGEGHALPFSDLLRMFRRRAGLTQAELAEKAGLSHRTISDLERGVRSKTYVSTVELLSTALDLDQQDSRRLAASVDRSRGSRGDRALDPSWQPANLRHG